MIESSVVSFDMCAQLLSKCSSLKKILLLTIIWFSHVLKVNWNSLHITSLKEPSKSTTQKYPTSSYPPYPITSYCMRLSRVDQEEGRKGKILERLSRRGGRRIERGKGEKVAGAPLHRSVWLHLEERMLSKIILLKALENMIE